MLLRFSLGALLGLAAFIAGLLAQTTGRIG